MLGDQNSRHLYTFYNSLLKWLIFLDVKDIIN